MSQEHLNHLPAFAEPTAPARQTNVFSSVARFLHVVRQWKALIIASMIISFAGGAIYYAVAPRKYDATAEIYIIRADGGSGGSAEQEIDMVERAIPTHVKLVSSQVVIKNALDNLGSDHLGDLEGIPESDWPDAIRRNLRVIAERTTSIINIRYRSRDPETAAAMVNAILASYLDFVNNSHRKSQQKDLSTLTREREDLESRLDDAERELITLRQQQGEIVDGKGEAINIDRKQTLELHKELLASRNTRDEAASFRAAVRNAIDNGQDVLQFALQSMDSVGKDLLSQEFGLHEHEAYLQSRIIQQLIADQAELRSIRQAYGRRHEAVRALEMRIEGAKAWYAHNETQRKQNSKTVQSHQLATRLLQISEQQYLHAVEHERRVADEFNKAYDNYLALGGPLAQIHFLDSQVKRMQMTYTALIEQISHYQSRQKNEALTETTMYPFPPRSPASPQLVIVILGSTFIGLFFGLGTIYIIDTLDDRFRSPEELTIQLGVPVLAMVRQMEETGGTGADSLQTFHNPNGVESEAFRTLRTAVAFSDTSMRIMATSSEPGDGKTTVMANLAVAYAQSGKRTLLIDADMRRPGMSTLFELRGPQGLSHILKDDAEISASIEKNMTRGLVNHLDFIPSGTRPLNPTELLSGDRFPELLAWAETIYDQILIDAPPILAVTDPAIVGRVVDGVILVIRPETNKRNMVIRATEQLKAVDLNLLGVVVNRASAEFGGDEYGNGFGYGYGYGYGHGYGHTNEDSDEPDDGIDKPDTLPLPIRDAA